MSRDLRGFEPCFLGESESKETFWFYTNPEKAGLARSGKVTFLNLGVCNRAWPGFRSRDANIIT